MTRSGHFFWKELVSTIDKRSTGFVVDLNWVMNLLKRYGERNADVHFIGKHVFYGIEAMVFREIFAKDIRVSYHTNSTVHYQLS